MAKIPSPSDVEALVRDFQGLRSRLPGLGDPPGPDGGPVTEPLRLAVVGEIKKGKSTLLNTLVGTDDLSPVSSDVATSVVYRVRHGSAEKACVEFNTDDDGHQRPRKEITRSEVGFYGTEDKNPENRLEVDAIELTVPSKLLERGVELLDTPGLGGLMATHAEVTWKHVPRAHLVMFVVDSTETLLSRQETDYLVRLHKLGLPMFFVQTKTDAADGAQVEAWKARNLDIISKTLKVPATGIRYFCVSSHLKQSALKSNNEKQLRRSGFHALEEYLVQRIEQHHGKARLGRLAALSQAVAPSVAQLSARLDARAAATESDGKRLREIEVKLTDERRALADWQVGLAKESGRAFQNALADLQRNIGRDLRNDFSGLQGTRLFDDALRSIPEIIRDPKRADAQGKRMLTSLADACTARAHDHLTVFRIESTRLIERLAYKVGFLDDVDTPSTERVESAVITASVGFKHDHTGLEAAEVGAAALAAASPMVSYLSASIGITAAAIGPGGLVLAPVLFAGTLLVRKYAKDRAEVSQLEAKLTQASQQVIRGTANAAMAIFEDFYVGMRRAGEEALDDALSRRRQVVSDLERALLDAKANAGSSASDAKTELDTLRAQLQDVKAFRKKIQEFVGTPAASAPVPA